MNRETVERTLKSEKSIAGQDSRHRLAKHLRKPGRWKRGCKGRRGRRGTQRGSVWGLHSEKQGHLRQRSRNKMPFFLPHVEKEEKNKCGFAAVSGSTRNHVSAVPGEHRRPQQEGRCVQGALWLLKQTQENIWWSKKCSLRRQQPHTKKSLAPLPREDCSYPTGRDSRARTRSPLATRMET